MSNNPIDIDNKIVELYLDSLSSGVPAITPKKAGVHMEACVWCLLECKHSNGVVLTVHENDSHSKYKVYWPENEIDTEAINRAYNRDDGPEQGAEAIAFLLIRERTNYTAIQRSVTTTGVDYWLGYQTESQSSLFPPASARLEVSAILRQTKTNKPSYRAQMKLEQTRQSDYTSFPAYVIIVEFSQPISKVMMRNATN